MTTEQSYDGEIEAISERIRQQEQADQQAATDKSTGEQTADTGKTEGTEGTTAAKTEGEGSTAVPAPADQGDVRGALRASRRAERQARDRATQLEAELVEARKRIPTPADEGVTDDELAELETDMPIVAKALRETRAIKAAIPKAPAPAPAGQPEFVAPVQPDHVQEVIDDIPALLQMQNDPDQSAFRIAVKHDEMLRALPAWKEKPMAERLAEAVRRAQADLGTSSAAAPAPQPPASPAPAATTRREPAAAVKEAPRALSTLSDIPGGAAPTTDTPGLKQFMAMKSDEEIMEALRLHG